jgi:hypothetical protein
MKGDIGRQVTNVVATIAVIVVNGLANALPLNGQTTGEISDRFQIYFVPAGYVFSIWGLIYLGIAGFAIYQALPGQRANPRLRQVGYLFALSSVANIGWLILWHYEQFVPTMAAMLVLLASLIAIYLRLGIGRSEATRAERWLVEVPFSIYLGWISVATIANAAAVLDYVNWSGWGISAEAWTILMLAVGAGLAWAMKLTRGDIAYLAVIVWAFVGIAVKQAGTPVVAGAAGLMAVLVAIALLDEVRAAVSGARTKMGGQGASHGRTAG